MKLSDEDRAKLGGPEWLEFEDRLSTREAEQIEAAGMSYRELLALNKPATAPAKAWRLAVWLCLNRAGVEIPLDEVHFNLFGLEPEIVGVGKAPSAKSGSRTRPASAATSTRPSRRKA